MVWRKDNQGINEAAKIRWDIVPYTKGYGLDVGCGPAKAFAHFIGVDNKKDVGLFNIQMNPDVVLEADNLHIYADRSMDFVFSSHLLEHIEDYEKALKEWWRVLKVGGYLLLYLPHKDFYPNIGNEDANPDHKHDFVPQDIVKAMKSVANSWDLLQCEERNEENEYSFYMNFRRTKDGFQRQSWKDNKPKKTAAVTRFGAFGDILQTSSVIAALKADGYHITFFCEDRGYEIAKTDQNIDKFVVQFKDQVPNFELGPYWAHLRKRFDKWVNFSESVEGSMLALPDRVQYQWPKEARHKYMNKNYLEFMHDIAGTQYAWFKEAQRFHATQDEIRLAKALRAKIPGYAIMWALAGSSCHKAWGPNVDISISRILTATDASVVTVGDKSCVMLEQGWENEARIILASGKQSIRETLALAQQVDLVVGPETGVLNSVAFDKSVGKIVILSHSSPENLTRDWYNTISLTTKDTPCYPCHMMHYDWGACHRTENGIALCAVNITADAMWEALVKMIPEEHFTDKEKRNYVGAE